MPKRKILRCATCQTLWVMDSLTPIVTFMLDYKIQPKFQCLIERGTTVSLLKSKTAIFPTEHPYVEPRFTLYMYCCLHAGLLVDERSFFGHISLMH